MTKQKHGHELFAPVRRKTLAAERSKDTTLECQYLFEEICAKTLYYLSGQPAPFDREVSFWIITNAFALARRVGINEAAIVEAVVHEGS
jgi:hypothetical protein